MKHDNTTDEKFIGLNLIANLPDLATGRIHADHVVGIFAGDDLKNGPDDMKKLNKLFNVVSGHTHSNAEPVMDMLAEDKIILLPMIYEDMPLLKMIKNDRDAPAWVNAKTGELIRFQTDGTKQEYEQPFMAPELLENLNNLVKHHDTYKKGMNSLQDIVTKAAPSVMDMWMDVRRVNRLSDGVKFPVKKQEPSPI